MPSGPRVGDLAAAQLGSTQEPADIDAIQMFAHEVHRAPVAVDFRPTPRPLKTRLTLAETTSGTTQTDTIVAGWALRDHRLDRQHADIGDRRIRI